MQVPKYIYIGADYGNVSSSDATAGPLRLQGSGPRKLGPGAVGNNRHWNESKWRDGSIIAGSRDVMRCDYGRELGARE